MSSGPSKLRVVYDWRETPLVDRLLGREQSITFGTGPRSMPPAIIHQALFFSVAMDWLFRRLSRQSVLVAPEGQHDHLGRDPWPTRTKLLRPGRRGHRLRLYPAMTGRLHLKGQVVDIGGLFTTPAPKRFLRQPAMHREVELEPGDSAEIVVDAVNQLRLSLSFVEAPETLARPRLVEPLLFKTAFWTVNTILASLIVIIFFGSRVPPFTPRLDLSPERLAKITPAATTLNKAAREAEAKLAAEAEARRKRQEREAAMARKAKEPEGKVGRADADRKETVMPKGREDVMREKVSRTGLLAIIGSSRPQSSGLGKLLSQENTELEQAVTGLQGAKLAAGRGSGGLGVAGQGLGGGGTSFGRIQGSGNLDLGAGRGRGRRGPNLGAGRERQVSVGLDTGTADAEGGLSKAQVERVVNAYKAAIGYCFQKELQRAPHLSGRVDLAWTVRANGTVDRARVAKSAMNNAAVEGCMVRTLRAWQFPKADADTIVQSFPFFFKGAGS